VSTVAGTCAENKHPAGVPIGDHWMNEENVENHFLIEIKKEGR